MSIDNVSSISSTPISTSKDSDQISSASNIISPYPEENTEEDVSSFEFSSAKDSHYSDSESQIPFSDFELEFDYLSPNNQSMDIDIKPNNLFYEAMDITENNSDNETNSQILDADKYIDIDDYFQTDDEYYDNECDEESTLNLNYSIYRNNDKQFKCIDMDTMVDELDEINKWIKFIRAINKMCEFEQIKYINKNISIELVNYSQYELRMKQCKCDIFDIDGKIIDNVSFDKYPKSEGIQMNGCSNEELRLEMEINYQSDSNYEELNGNIGDYMSFDEMDVNINECLSYYKSTNYEYIGFIRANMRCSEAYKSQVAYNKQLINALIEMLEINNEKLQREILYILKYISHKNTECMVMFNKLFINLMNTNGYHTQKSTEDMERHNRG